ncbi:hypothetical protein, partial [Mesorhizobium sp. M8A.F.Ca.ET.213.01.1.1]|uniref:hypothetical protein n=2 Tax=unclassified Mesorhizobium TaxID=325217 RepID=UPI001AEEBD08
RQYERRLLPGALDTRGRKMVPRGGFEAKEIWLCFQIVDAHTRAGIANKNTNKIFLWIGSVPGNRSIRSMPSHPNLISEAER